MAWNYVSRFIMKIGENIIVNHIDKGIACRRWKEFLQLSNKKVTQCLKMGKGVTQTYLHLQRQRRYINGQNHVKKHHYPEIL